MFKFLPTAGLFSIAVATLGFHSTPVAAQHANLASAPCQNAGSMVDTSNCLQAAFQHADMDLNDTYRQIMAVLDREEKVNLRDAQRAWITYRDKACEAEATPYRGSGRGIAEQACLEAITRQRTQFLRDGLWWQVDKSVS